MPHATAVPDVPTETEDQEFLAALQALNDPNESDLQDRALDIGEKADDAVNYEDLSDDDLPDDEGEEPPLPEPEIENTRNTTGFKETASELRQDILSPALPTRSSDNAESLDDLFGDVISSPVETDFGGNRNLLSKEQREVESPFDFDLEGEELALRPQDDEIRSDPLSMGNSNKATQRNGQAPLLSGILNAALSKEQRMQQALFEMSSSAPRALEIPGPETQEQALDQLWPRFRPDSVPRFMDLLPPKKARFLGKPSLRRPKPVHPTRVNLEIAMDHERSFRLASTSHQKPLAENIRQDLVHTQQFTVEEEPGDAAEDIESDLEHDEIAGFNWQDLQILCGDWDTQSSTENSIKDHYRIAETNEMERDDVLDDNASHLSDHLEAPMAKVRSSACTQPCILTRCRGENWTTR